MKLEIRLFRFNAKHDYLPSYQPFIYRAGDDETLLDLMNNHKKNDPLFLCNLSNVYGVKVNGYACRLETKLKDLADKLGKDFRIEPLDTARATLDLEIDTTDFDEQLQVFSSFIDGSDSNFYNQLITYHYASKVRRIDSNYLGAAGFALASRLLEKNPSNREKLFEIAKNGKICSYEGVKTVFGDTVNIDSMIINLQSQMGIAPKTNTIFQAGKLAKVEGKNIAVISDENIDLAPYLDLIRSSGATAIKLDPDTNAGSKILDPSIAKTLAKEAITHAFDRGSDAVVCADQLTYDFLTKSVKKSPIEILKFS